MMSVKSFRGSARGLLSVVAVLLAVLCTMLSARTAFAAGEKRVNTVSDIEGNQTVYLLDFDADGVTMTINDTTNFHHERDAEGNQCIRKRSAGAGVYNNPFSIKYSNLGYTLDGRRVDMVLTCTRLQTLDTFTADYSVARINSNNGAWQPGMFVLEGTGVSLTYKVDIYYTGTQTKVPNARYLLYFNDLDTLGRNDSRAFVDYAESVRFDSGYDASNVYISSNSCLNITTNEGKPVYEGTRATSDPADEWNSGVAVIAQQDFTFTFRIYGWGCATAFGAQSSPVNYPNPPAPVKATNPATIASDGTATFTITENFPDVYEGNAPKSIAVSDTLAKCLDVSKATVKVERTDENGAVRDVTSNWTKTVTGQTLLLSTTKTAHGQSTLKHVFTITVPMRKSYDFNDGQLAWANQNLKFTNKATVTIVPKVGNNITKTSNEITETVTGSVNPKILLQKGDVNLGAGTAQGDTTLAGAVYKVSYWAAWSEGATPTAVGTWTTNDAGEVDFKKSDWPYASGEYAILPFGTYRVEEVTAPAGYGKMAPRTFVVEQSNATGKMTLTKGAGWDEGTTTADTGLVSIEPSIVKGTVAISLEDAENVTAQGDGKLAGAVVEIKNASDHPVVVDGVTYQPGDVVKTVTLNEDGKAAVPNLPYGSYEVSQKTPSEGYLKDNNVITVEVHSSGVVTAKFKELVFRGAMQASKQDKDGKKSVPQGDATLEGAKFEILNRSVHEVIVGGRTYQKDAVVLTVTSNASGSIRTALRALPYGTYEIREKADGAPVGYKPSSDTATFVVREDNELVTKVK